MENKPDENRRDDLPPCATEFIQRVVRRMWYRRRARRDVQAELTAHFEDAVRGCATAEEKERKARELIEAFGDAKLLAALCHRAKKRCRPLWLKVLLRSGQGLGVAFLYWTLCTLPILLGRPTIRVNYTEWLSNHWRPNGQGVENAKSYYDKAVELYVEPPQGLEDKMRLRRWSLTGYYDERDMQLIDQWLAKNQAAFDMVRHGASMPHYWPIYDSNESAPLEVSIVQSDLKIVEGYRPVALAFKQQIICEARRGEVAEALDDCLVLRKFGRHLQNKGALNSQTGGISIEHLGYDSLIAILQRPDVPSAILERIQKELVSDFDLNRQAISLDGEKALWYGIIQRTFTDDGQGGGHALSQGFPYARGDWKHNLVNTFRFHYPDRRETVTMVERYFQWAQGRLNAPPDRHEREKPDDSNQVSSLSIFFSITTPAYERVAQLAWRLKTHETAVVTLLAIQRYFRANGNYPDNLYQLVEQGFLKEPPRDPFGQGTLSYRREDRGFILYCWGSNFKDDGGQLGTDSQGSPRMWADNGDWVFWPVGP
jgi:hypothetical protein